MFRARLVRAVRVGLTPLVAACFVVTSFVPVPTGAQVDDNPWSFNAGGPWVSGDPADPAVSQHNFAMMMQRSNANRQLLYGYAQMDAAAQGANGGHGGLQPPITEVKPDRAADAIPKYAELLQSKYFAGESIPQVTQYLRERVRDYARTVLAQGMPQTSVPVACDYAVEGLYHVGGGIDVAGGETRQNIRGTCTIVVSALQGHGYLVTNAQRQAMLQYLAIVGAAYRERDQRLATTGDAAARTKNSEDARATFKQLIGNDIAKLPPEHFPCLMADKTMTCDQIMQKGPPVLAKLVAKYP